MDSLDKLRGTEVRISFDGGGLTEIDGRAFALLQAAFTPGRWKLYPDERTGKDHFVIVDAQESFAKGLKLTDTEEGDAQLEVGAIPMMPTMPPTFPANVVWVLEAVGADARATTACATSHPTSTSDAGRTRKGTCAPSPSWSTLSRSLRKGFSHTSPQPRCVVSVALRRRLPVPGGRPQQQGHSRPPASPRGGGPSAMGEHVP